MTSKFRCGFNRHQPVLENLSATPLFAFSTCQCFTGYPRGNFFVMARSASVALGEVGLVFHVLLMGYVSTFLLRLVPILVSLVSSVCSLSALFLSKRKHHISYITDNNYDKSFVKQKDVQKDAVIEWQLSGRRRLPSCSCTESFLAPCKLNQDHYTFLGICPPTPSLSQHEHFILPTQGKILAQGRER